ncbi:Rho GTPase activation protein, partial [Syncephalis fuscata]
MPSTLSHEHQLKEGVIFAVPLEVAVSVSSIDADWQVPAVLIRCTEFLDEHGLNEVGLYRIPGRWSDVTRLRQHFDRGLDFDLLNPSMGESYHFDVTTITANTVATLLKMYLRELPELLFTHTLLPLFNSKLPCSASAESDTTTDEELKAAESMRLIADQLPMANRHVLHWISCHLRRLAMRCERNKMTLSNLGLIFCPTL